MYRDSDRLLYAISAKKEIPWPVFKRDFDYLYALQMRSEGLNLDRLPHRRSETVNAIESLSHCDIEFSEHGGRVFVAPPALVRLPVLGLPQAILTGSRSPQTVRQLSETCRTLGYRVNVEVSEQAADLALVPARVHVKAESIEQIAEVAGVLGIAFEDEPPAWAILHFASSLDDYLAACQWASRKELNWRRKDFNPGSLRFGTTLQETLVRLSSYIDPIRNIQTHLLWKNGQHTEVNRDWGRYATLKESGINVLVYDQRRLIMAVPASVPLPRLFARALALCSGYAARFIMRENFPYPVSEPWGFNLFRDVPPQIAEIVAAKLGQALLPYDLGCCS